MCHAVTLVVMFKQCTMENATPTLSTCAKNKKIVKLVFLLPAQHLDRCTKGVLHFTSNF